MKPSFPSSVPPRGLLAALNAVRNASGASSTEAGIRAMIATGRGDPSQLRALFGDVSRETLIRLAIAFDIETPALLASYATARAEVAAANPGLDALLDDQG